MGTMESFCRAFLLFAFAAWAGKAASAATQHMVGGSQGWDESADLTSWASGRTFKVGDQLIFKYTSGLHSVVELAGETAYKNCNIGSSVDSLNGGNNVVKLDKAGTRYFACGTLGHCDQGMKLKVITVTGNASSSPASSSPSSTSAAASFSFNSFVLNIAALLATSFLFMFTL